ncbi:MAG: Sec1 family protein, partial [Microbacteriaceae bacterium]|nr:Sec1 family protein [Microbacteriaceae bacterium]
MGIRNELIDCLDSVRGNKALVVDQKLLGPLGLLTEFTVLREHFVEKVHPLTPARMDTPCTNIIYMCRPRVEYMKYIAEHVKTHNKENQKKHYSIFFVPRSSMIAERVLEEEGVFGDVTVSSWNMDLVPFDDDLISLELENSFRDCFLEGDPTSLYYVARSVMKLQDYFGLFPKILGIGDSARQVKDMVLRMSKERGPTDEQAVLPQIESLILIDRQVDMATPLATQMTFEGLIDELIGINCSLIEVEAELLDPDGKSTQGHPPGKKLVYPLNSNDLVYSEFRDQNIEALASLVRTKAKGIQDSYDQLQSLQSVSELRGFVTTLPSLKQQEHSLGILNNIAHKITSQIKNDDFIRRIEAERSILSGTDPELALNFISEMIDRQMPMIKVLRLLCLFCVVHGGLTAKHFDHYQREIVHSYGYDAIFTMHNLVRLNLLRRVTTRSAYQLVHKPLQLFCPEVKKVEPDDIAHVFSGYAPLSVRLVQYSINPGWRAIPEHVRAIGTAFEVTQSLPPAVAANLQRKTRTSSQRSLD